MLLTTKEKGLLTHIIDHCIRIEETILKIDSYETFLNDKNMKDVACFNILQIGELAKSFEPSFLEVHNGVPWQKIKGMRDRVAHGYGTINFANVWETCLKDIQLLHSYCEQLLNNK